MPSPPTHEVVLTERERNLLIDALLLDAAASVDRKRRRELLEIVESLRRLYDDGRQT